MATSLPPDTPRAPDPAAPRRPEGLLRRPALAFFLVLILLALAIQLVPYGRAHANPPVVAEPAWDSPRTEQLFARACADCHSNETAWPWYSRIAPASWLITHDVEEGRAKLNVSEWGRAESEADEAAETVQEGEMPLWFYAPLHPAAWLTDRERQELIDGLVATFGDDEIEP